MKKYIRLIIISCSLLFIDCNRQTRFFKNIEVHGRLVNFFTKQPIQNVEVRLRANDAHSASSYAEARILLDSYSTDNNGDFVLKSKASKQDDYQIQLDTEDHIYSYSSVDTFFTSKPNNIIYIGNIYSGEHLFWFKIQFFSTTGNCAWVYSQNQQYVKINSGTDTTIVFNSLLSYYFLRENKNIYNYHYKIGSCANPNSAIYASKTIAISSADTIHSQINY